MSSALSVSSTITGEAPTSGSYTWLNELILRVTANNPSPMTGQGTNSYLIGGPQEKIVIDPGPDEAQHRQNLLHHIDGAKVRVILITHPHLDHSQGARALANQVRAPIYAFGDAQSGRSVQMQRLLATGYQGGGEGGDLQFVPDRVVKDQSDIGFTEQAIRVLHVPGHMGAHLCFGWGNILFSGDHVMAESTTMISPPDGDLTAFMEQSKRLMQAGYDCFLPGHGAALLDPRGRVQELIAHRQARHMQIQNALAAQPSSAAQLVHEIYSDVPKNLHAAAQRNLFAHLLDLVWSGQAEFQGKMNENTPVSLR